MAKAAAQTKREVTIKWRPQPKQLKFLRACGLAHPFVGGKPSKPIADIIGYGGAAGGGKSDALMGAAIVYGLTYPGARIGYFRQTFTQLDGEGGAIARSLELLSQVAKYNSSKHQWVFPNKSTLRFCYLQRDADLPNYQSQQFECLLFDEGTQFTWHRVAWMQQRIRSVKGYPTFTAIATNPGGIGHGWFKKFFVKSGEPEVSAPVEVEEGKFKNIVFIPSRLSDNQILENADPHYRKKLEALPENLRRQFLDGDWDVAEGMAFTEWRDHKHVIPPFEIPEEWIRFRSLDWGHSKPYSVGWYAVDFDGRLYKYRELYGYGGREDVGTKEDPADVAAKIIEKETLPDGSRERIRYAVADDAIFGGRQDNSPSIAEQFAEAFGDKAVHWEPVGKGPRSRISGKLELHHRLKWKEDEDEPMLQFFNTCFHTVRTLPNMVLDEKDPEDVDTSLEDHAYDETRYACMSRPMAPKKPPQEDGVIKRHKKKLASRQRQATRRVG